jgi:hypothetical protein
MQVELEGISEQLRVPGSKPLGAIERVCTDTASDADEQSDVKASMC